MTKSTGANSKPQPLNIIFIGAGRLATQMAKALHHCGHNISYIYSRTQQSASSLASIVEAKHTTDINALRNNNADLWIYAIKDDTINLIANQLPNKNAIHIHTSGSVPTDIFEGIQTNYGCIYPLQTFNKDRDVNFSEIPIFYEANNPHTNTIIKDISNQLSSKTFEMNFDKRKHLHLAAVFACNFTNVLWASAELLLENQNIDNSVLYPLINETLQKAMSIGAANSQTGPAIRNDQNTINNHIDLLKDNPQLQDIYIQITNLIQKQN